MMTGPLERVKAFVKDFDEGRLMLQNSKYSRSICVPNWGRFKKDKQRKGWTTVSALDELVAAELLDPKEQIFVVIDGGKEEWIK